MKVTFDCGIDFGTINSCIAIPNKSNGFQIIESLADRMQVTPSAVAIDARGRILLGQRAYNSRDMEKLAINFKKFIGTNTMIQFGSAGVRKFSEELVSEIFCALKNDVETYLDRQIESAVIAVPATFTESQYEAMIKAGKFAGFKNIILLPEPIAVAMAYGVKFKSKNKRWMVFDYGGGTLDVTVISVIDNQLIIENCESECCLGAKDFDKMLFEKIVRKRITDAGYVIDNLFDETTSEGKALIRRILSQCEACRCELCTKTSVLFELFDVNDDEDEPIEFECEITRKEFEVIISSTIERSIEIARKVLIGSNIGDNQMDKILLVGGNTYIPLVRRRLAEEFGVEVDGSLNPLTVIAAGAAIYASRGINTVDENSGISDIPHAIINLTYDPITCEKMVNVIGKVANVEEVRVKRIKFDRTISRDFSGNDWTSGWVELLDIENGIFDIDVPLEVGMLNHFKISAYDEKGIDIVIENPLFNIKHNVFLKTTSCAAVNSIGVQIQDPKKGQNILHHLIKKNTLLPASGEIKYIFPKDFYPDSEECITIKIWEGENVVNPEANYPAGEITIQAAAMDRIIPKGTEIELTITEDECRIIHVRGYIPDFDYEIPTATLRSTEIATYIDENNIYTNTDTRRKRTMQKFFDCGIDLGTTNSCLAIPDDDHGFEIIENQADRMQVTPSAVLINGKGRMLIGQRAYNSQKVEDLAIQFKRSMGSNKMVQFGSAGIQKSPEELSSEILKALRSDAETRLNRPIENVVITVPAAFKTLQSEATNKAGNLAGFKNIILLQEPIAAAVAYGAKPNSKDKHWMVFDYGGGTLDVAIISTTDNRLTVENSEGDNYFGGSDIDRLMFKEIILKKLVEEGYKVDDLFDETTSSGKSLVRKIQLDCENCKIELSTKTTTIFELFDIDDDDGEPIEFECEITRKELESLISATVERSIEIAKKALEGANIRANQLDKILLVGGSTFIPLVRQRLTEEFRVELDSSLNPMTVVAAGAAIYASTSVIDVEEDVELTDASHAIINLTYDATSSESMVNVIGKVANIEDVSIAKIKIDCATSDDFSGVDWTSGWIELFDTENGIFDVDVLLQAGKLNHFKVSACDEKGTDIVIENPLFDIKHNENVLKNSAPPATMSIGVQIQDPKNGYDILYHLVKKNTPLPASGEQTFKLSRDFNPNAGDCITIKIWEGENVANPEANHSAGEITIQSSAMDRIIPKGTEIDLTITEDEGRMIHVSGYIPDFEYEIPEHTLRAEAKVDLAESMDKVDTRIQQSEVSLQRLKDQGVDVSDLEDELEQVKAAYDDTYDLVDTDEKAVNGYVDAFNDIETRIIEQERKNQQSQKSSKEDAAVAEAREQVEEWGDADAKATMEELEESYKMAQTEDEKAFVVQKMTNLGFIAMTSNFTWLRGFFMVVLAKPETTYTNPQKAEYWKSQGYQAIDNENTSQLRNVVFELLDLMTSSANQAISSFGADLTM